MKRRLDYLTAATVGLALGAVSILGLAAVARSSGAERQAYWQSRRDLMDDPELWSIEALPSRADWPPVTLCADARARTGFARSLPVENGMSCLPTEPARERDGLVTVRCELAGRRWVATTSLEGDPASDFTTTSWITDADLPLAHGGRRYVQSLRFRRLGACPPGWKVGDHTDRTGRRLTGAIHVSPNGSFADAP